MHKSYRWVYKNSLPYFSGAYGTGITAGAFCLDVTSSEVNSGAYFGGRLMFL